MNIKTIYQQIFIIIFLLFSHNGNTADLPGAGIKITKVDSGVWMHTSYYVYPSGIKFPSNGLIIQEGSELTLIDTAWGELQTVNLLKSIKLKINLPVTKAVITHAHGDRAAGVDFLESIGVEVYAHPLTKKLTIEQGSSVPDRTFKGLDEAGTSIKFGSFNVAFPGAGHTVDNLMVWLPEKRILFGGCAIRAMSFKSAGNTAHGDIHSWLKIIKRSKNIYGNAKMVVPGHGEIGGVELLEHTEQAITNAINNLEH